MIKHLLILAIFATNFSNSIQAKRLDRHIKVRNTTDPEIVLIKRKIQAAVSDYKDSTLPNLRAWQKAAATQIENIEDLYAR